jgi:hypothetical protein
VCVADPTRLPLSFCLSSSIILFGMGTLGLGLLSFTIWSWYTKQWPFARELQGGL